MEAPNILGLGAIGGTVVLVVYIITKYCIRKKIHAHFKSGCCESDVGVEPEVATPK